jgi:hypothetical protein
MADIEPRGASLATPDGQLRVEFRWHSDRFVQKLFALGDEVGSSVEGDALDPWPPSPPVQQISLEEVAGSTVILGLGAAGRCHWSISVEVDRREDSQAILFDLACRCSDHPGFLGNTYRVSRCIELLSPSGADLAGDGDPIDRAAASDPGAEGDCIVTVHATNRDRNTYRWSYRLELKNP